MIFYTLGYGLGKGSHAKRKADFQDRIRKAFSDNMTMVDLRKEGCGSRNGKAFYQGHAMAWLMREIDLHEIGVSEIRYGYTAFPGLANKHGASQKALRQYAEDVAANGCKNGEVMKLLKNIHHYNEYAFCLLCGCRDAYKASGAINCHRVVLAEVLLKELGDGWEVEHLGENIRD